MAMGRVLGSRLLAFRSSSHDVTARRAARLGELSAHDQDFNGTNAVTFYESYEEGANVASRVGFKRKV